MKIKNVGLLVALSLALSGCIKMEVIDELQLDGTSKVLVNIDGSQMMTQMAGVQSVMGSFKSCTDPDLLERYELETYIPSTEAVVKEIEKPSRLTCEVKPDRGALVSVEAGGAKHGNYLEASSCSDPALLAQISEKYEQPVTAFPHDLPPSITTQYFSCEETEDEKLVIKSWEQSETGSKSNSSTLTVSRAKASDSKTQVLNLCDSGQAKSLALNFVDCNNKGNAIAELNFERRDTRLLVNKNGDLHYNLDLMLEAVDTMDVVAPNSGANNVLGSAAEAKAIGAEFTYSLKSPWPIVSTNVGTKVDDNTLLVDIYEYIDAKPETPAIVVLEAPNAQIMSSAKELPVTHKLKVKSWVNQLEEKLDKYDKLEDKITIVEGMKQRLQAWAGADPGKNILVAYLEQQLVFLVEQIQFEAQNNF